MSINNGIREKRNIVGAYNGFNIIKVDVEYLWFYYGRYHKNIVDKRESYFTFSKSGKNKSACYNVNEKAVSGVMERIDEFVKDDTLYFTNGELNKYVYAPNHKNEWGFTKDELLKLIKSWKRANNRRKKLYEERLTDANFHDVCSYLAKGDMEGAICFVREEY